MILGTIKALAGTTFTLSTACYNQDPIFTPEDIKQIKAYWSAPGRYVAAPSSDRTKGPWVVRLTPDASLWLWNYNNRRGNGKTAPTQLPPANSEQEAYWEGWIDAMVKYDRYIASLEAKKLNDALWRAKSPDPEPVVSPGMPPQTLITFAGAPPKFASCVRPTVHNIKFEDMTLSYEDNVDMRPRYAYYRFPDGVMSGGTRMKDVAPTDVQQVLESAGVTDSVAKVFKAVSLLEGGFDSINTYDTGYVSVAFIQFAALSVGGHSLGQTLLRYKTDDPENFKKDFQRFGIEVTETGTLVALDLETGTPKVGPDANATIIKDKRLIAVFQRAGRFAPYRVAQLKVAKSLYYPADDQIKFTTQTGVELSGKVSDVMKTEAGIATLMDRKVNTGTIALFVEAAKIIAEAKGITNFADLAKYEHVFINALWYRKNYTRDNGLSQPEPAPDVPQQIMSRWGSRYGRSN